MRFLRLPLMMCCFRRSSGVIELMIASIRATCFSSGACSASAFTFPIPGSIPTSCSSGPSLRTVRS